MFRGHLKKMIRDSVRLVLIAVVVVAVLMPVMVQGG